MTTTHLIRQQLSVAYDFPVVFTREVFHPDNRVLRETLARPGEPQPHRLAVVIDAGVAAAFPGLADTVERYVAAHGDALALAAPPRIAPGGEAAKQESRHVMALVDLLVDLRLCRHSYVVAVGGGALLDAAGFAAALVHRGLRLVRVPTTVLAQNDSGVGVKNAVNYRGLKNLLGTFAPPFAVINDAAFLCGLPQAAWTDGIAEAFKVAVIKDAAFFDWLCAQAPALAARDEAAMEPLIRRCAELHLEHIRTGGDPFEFGEARPLDFGHWSAHRLEALSGYSVSHGHAVAIGLVLDAWYAVCRGWLAEADFMRLYAGLRAAGFTLWHALLERRSDGTLDLLQGLQEFREHLGGRLCVTMPRGIGARFEIHEIEAALVEACVRKLRELAGKPC